MSTALFPSCWQWIGTGGGNCWCIICAFNAAIQCNTLKLECQMAATRHRQLINTMVLLFDMHCIQVSHYGATVKLLSLGNVLPTWWSNLVKMWISDWVTWVRKPILIWNGFHMNFTFTSQCHQRPHASSSAASVNNLYVSGACDTAGRIPCVMLSWLKLFVTNSPIQHTTFLRAEDVYCSWRCHGRLP